MDLDLSGGVLIGLDLSFCHLRHATFARASFIGGADFTRVTFTGDAGFAGTSFAKVGWFSEASFAGNADFSGTHARAPDGFLLAYGADVQKGRPPRGSIVDVT